VTSKDAGSRATRPGHHFRHRRLDLPEGGALVLATDGSITRVDAAGAKTERWVPADPEWAGHALRFGLVSRAPTVAPHGPGDPTPRPLGG
jgi:hypothetical protein